MGEYPISAAPEAREKGYKVPFGCTTGFIIDKEFVPAEVHYRRNMGNDRCSTLGERRVGYTFNPSGNILVEYTKLLAAKAIDALESTRTDGQSEKNRTISRAQTAIEDGCMLSVKSMFQ
jgi:hypothetical protein